VIAKEWKIWNITLQSLKAVALKCILRRANFRQWNFSQSHVYLDWLRRRRGGVSATCWHGTWEWRCVSVHFIGLRFISSASWDSLSVVSRTFVGEGVFGRSEWVSVFGRRWISSVQFSNFQSGLSDKHHYTDNYSVKCTVRW